MATLYAENVPEEHCEALREQAGVTIAPSPAK